MKRQHHFGIIVLTILLFSHLIGCDDNNPTANDSTIKYLVIGSVVLWPSISFYGTITSIYGEINDIDSVLIADSACVIEQAPSSVEGNQYSYTFSYFKLADSLRFQSGDTAFVRIVRDDEVVVVPVKLLQSPQDTIVVISPSNMSSVQPNEDIPVVWHKIPNADWYGIYIIHDTSAFSAPTRQAYRYSLDTTYTIPGNEHPMESEYHIYISATTGPAPNENGNINSETMTGAMYSTAYPSVRFGLEISVETTAK